METFGKFYRRRRSSYSGTDQHANPNYNTYPNRNRHSYTASNRIANTNANSNTYPHDYAHAHPPEIASAAAKT